MAFEPNASLPAPSLTDCADFEDRARKMLHRAWDNPKELGEDSEICREATALLSEIRQYCSPEDKLNKPSPARENFHNALRLAWLAVWRARDYSAAGIAKRSQVRKWPRAFRLLDVSHGMYFFQNEYWFAHHYPLFDRNGEPVARDGVSFERPHHFQQLPWYQEGTMVSAADQIRLSHEVVLEWAHVSSDLPEFDGGISLRSCMLTGPPKRIDCTNRPIPLCGETLAFSSMAVTRFRAASSKAIAGCRFESGLRLEGAFEDAFGWSSISADPLIFERCTLSMLNMQNACIRDIQLNKTEITETFNLRGRKGIKLHIDNATIKGFEARETEFDYLYVGGTTTGAFQCERIVVSGDCHFVSVEFEGNANFRGAKLSAKPLTMPPKAFAAVWMRRCKFQHSANFDECSFGGATFEDSSFHGDTSFRSAEFAGPADFRGTEWSAKADFSSDALRHTTFLGGFDISHTDADLPAARMQWCSFAGVHFHGPAQFQNRRFMSETWFDRATFRHAPEFHGSKLHSKTFFSGARFGWASKRLSPWWERAIASRTLNWFRQYPTPSTMADARELLDVVNCFRVLTSLANDIDAKDLAYRFHKEELRAKYRLPLANGVSRPEAFVGRVYGLLADYGDSFVRPLVGLLLSIVLFGLFYASPFLANSGRWNAAAATSAALQFRPVAALDPAFGRLPTGVSEDVCKANVASKGSITTECMQYHLRKDHELAVKAASIGQTLMTFIFLFLTLLALRRKYQVS